MVTIPSAESNREAAKRIAAPTVKHCTVILMLSSSKENLPYTMF
jgi:hypothetical protein